MIRVVSIFLLCVCCYGQGLTLRDVAFVGTGGSGGGETSGGGGAPFTAPSFWWELDETGTNDRVDSVASLAMTDHGATATYSSDTGKVNDAFKFTAGSSTTDYLGADPTATLVTSGTSLSMCWWHKATHAIGYYFEAYDAMDNHLSYFYMQDFGASIQITAENDAGGDATLTVSGSVRDDTWRFMAIRWDSATGKVAYSVNGGAFTESTETLTLQHGAKGQISIYGPGNGTILTDQLGLWLGYKLTDSDASWLYNSGNGRAYADF